MRYRAFIASDESNLLYRLEYCHNLNRWRENLLPNDSPLRDLSNWSDEYKYFNNDGSRASDSIYNLPNNVGGIYVFYLKGLNLPFFENYILYIGRCKSTDRQYIRKRALEYQHDDRPLIKEMMTRWKDRLFYRYYPDHDNDRIDKTEVILIRAILPYYNEEIPDNVSVQPSTPAFEL